MLTPTVVDLAKGHFYPFGNTPAVNFLRDYRPSNSDNVDILALGCGDARNLLFSLWSEHKGNGCKFNFTVCDLNPAVFARNIFLLSAIQTLSLDAGDADYDLLSRLWRIYYHLFITQDDLTFVKQHVSHLRAASGSLEAWLQSPFGSVFHFSSESTLMEIRSFWNSYSELRTTDQDQQVRQSITSLHVGDWHINGRIARVTSHGMRSAGAHSLESVDSMNQALHEFWKTGVVAGNFDDVAMLRRENGGCVNPLISGSPTCPTEFAVPYGVEPLIGYHLAEAFSSTQSVPTSMDVLAKLAKSQFFDWCRSFTLCVKSKSVSVMCHTGEAINFAHALQDLRGSPTLPADTHRYTKPWCATQLLLEPTLTSQFDIIDTSNIIDHHGILNVLPAVTPLLKHAPCSILYFESLLQAAEKHESTLETLLHANVTTISLLLGVTPMGHILDTTTDSFESEEIFDRVCPPTTGCLAQLRLRIPFRTAFRGDRELLRDRPCKPFPLLRINPQELASFFKQAYLSMFREAEDTSIRNAVMLRKMNRPLAGDRFFYSRLSLVTLVAAAKRTVQTDWKACINALMESIENDRTLILGSNGMQELYLHFHQTGLWDVPLLRADPRGQMTPYGRTRSRDESGVLGSDDLPAIVHVALVVPRSKLRIFTDRPADQVGTPGLRLTVFNDQLFDDFNFYAIDTFFGRLKEAPAANGDITIDEDPQGWSGMSDLIVTCAVPAWPLLVGNRKDVCLGLVVNSNASFDTVQYSLHLGFRTQVFTANLDSNHVKIFARAPTKAVSATAQPTQNSAMCIDSIDGDFQVSEEKPAPEISNKGSDDGPNSTTESAETISWVVQLKNDCTVQSITATKAFAPNSETSHALKKGTAMKISQISPCVMELSLEQLTHRIAFPYPINGMKAKLTRNPVSIELSAPTSNSIEIGGYAMNPFPVIDQNGTGDFLAWGMGRVDIDRQPLIKLPVDHLWLEGMFATASTRADRALNLSDMDYSRKPAMLKLREGLPLLFMGLVGLHPRFPGKIFRLYVLTEGDKVDAFLISNAIHHDRDSGSIFLDAFVVPLTPEVAKSGLVQPTLNANRKEIIDTAREEMILWKHLIPAAVERCRTWEHKETCEYKINTTNTIPLSTFACRSPICTCGNGQDTNHLPPEFKPLAKFATRVAIPIIHAIPYMVAMMLDKLPNSTSSQTPASPRDICGHCGSVKFSGLKACTRCEKVKYCNHACQKAAWKEHKKVCKR
ncbi:hypothetical protein D6D03_02944 [Aureobasidium pullulans]|nr:hypothetical protein D6D26_00703 [Aureobasidium pullulans]THY05529.1 hypothetical protein D6D03_02944 [Aureobasidium pullulans]